MYIRSLLLVVVSTFFALTSAIKFDLSAVKKDRFAEGTKCLSQYVSKDTLILATVNVGEGYNQRVELEITDTSENRNVYIKKSNVNGELRNAFTTIDDGEVMVCFTNVLDDGFQEGSQYRRTIELQFSVGAEATDFKNMAKAEKLTPLELELRKLETVVKEIVDEMNYLKRREARMRDTNGKKKKMDI
ncbi:emp24/gp25L/p24 family/GOLD-domain-containing protein [Cokeromyces recurvatus]|uniref:emp24/gp25L/p24 family/GOLD-domain-containing protein n=1 Tax=Cokeromyces recurvatus TaxID=90255 RepID=UPI00221E744E|nr:emp24/gp25L/p24 family/GOLD-domain-containing protein [Cokeromyces recurvatus]KAI7898526.1 emp24/gp25L/p24 family/GOLD-domain-containing protein [Cokeromyces recurvatus]